MMMDSLRQDLTYAVRSFARTPALTVVIIISIGLGIAANTTVFSIVNELLIRDIPVRDPGRLFVLEPGAQPSSSIPAYLEFRDQTGGAFEGLAAHSLLPVAANISTRGNAQRIWGLLVSGNYFSVTGVQPILGRGILPSEDEVRGRDAVVVLGYGLWRRLGADPEVVGRSIVLSGAPYTVVGVAPPGFFGTDRGVLAEFWAPLAMRTHLAKDIAAIDANRNCQWLEMTGRLRPGILREQAVAAANVVHSRMVAQHEKNRRAKPVELFRVGYFPVLQSMLNQLMTALAIVVVLLLLIACANVANLLLARAASRQHEIAVRLAIGASRARIVRQLLTESVLLATAGAALGFLLAVPGTTALSRIQPPLGIPMRFDFSPDLRVLAFTTALAVMTGILFGLAPALIGARGNLTTSIRQGGWGGGGARSGRLAGVLVGAQVTVSVVLLIAAGLFLRSLQSAASIDVGMKGPGALMMAIDPKGQDYPPDKAKKFMLELQRRIEAIPGVESMGYVDLPPLSWAVSNADFLNADRSSGQRVSGDTLQVSAHYFSASGISLLRGRDFDGQRDDKAPVVIINQALAMRLFDTENPIGRHIRVDVGDEAGSKKVYEVVGLVRNAKAESLGEGEVACMFHYFSDFDGAFSIFGVTMMVRAGGDPLRVMGAVRKQVETLDPDLPLFNVETLANHIDEALMFPRVSGALFGAFGSFGLLLAVVGLYAVVNYSVRRRTREIGIRLALGAQPRAVYGAILRQGMGLVGVGLAVGLAVAFALSRFTASLLYGIVPTDPVTFLGVPVILVAASLVAVILPARRAARIEPLVALREE
jgi:predicted permease